MVYYNCSDGKRVNQSQINTKYSKSIRDKHIDGNYQYCQACLSNASHCGHIHNDHTISQKRCKEIHKTELIWNPLNYVSSCIKCHQEWESYKSGKWIAHENMLSRLQFLKDNDYEGYIKRVELTRISLDTNEIRPI